MRNYHIFTKHIYDAYNWLRLVFPYRILVMILFLKRISTKISHYSAWFYFDKWYCSFFSSQIVHLPCPHGIFITCQSSESGTIWSQLVKWGFLHLCCFPPPSPCTNGVFLSSLDAFFTARIWTAVRTVNSGEGLIKVHWKKYKIPSGEENTDYRVSSLERHRCYLYLINIVQRAGSSHHIGI